MKKLLIIQQDEAYFLFETFVMLDRHQDAFKDFELTLLVNLESLKQIQDGSCTLPNRVKTVPSEILGEKYDLSVNLSLNERSWEVQDQVIAEKKLGCLLHDKQLMVEDVWSAYFLTIKAKAPFLAFHLQDFYKNILGIRKMSHPKKEKKTFHQIAFSLSHTNYFSAQEQEKFIHLLHTHYPHIKIMDLSEIDPVSDLTHVLYIGPASLEALKICEDGAAGIFLTSKFQGFNLIPRNEGHAIVSSKNLQFSADLIGKFIDRELGNREIPELFPYAIYKTEEDHLFGSYIKSLNASDENYPIYQSHVVLWNYLLNLFDTNLEITSCTHEQIEVLKSQKVVLQKLIRLYDYAMSSIDTIHLEARSETTDGHKLQGHLKNLQDIEEISDKISQSHVYLRPVLDFYRIRRGQNTGTTLIEQSQHSFLMYSEEHQALKALLELFTVTLTKNEASI